jgi:hypothetical protein
MMHMRTRTIISLERAQLRALKARARAKGISVAELMRGLVQECLEADRTQTPVPLSTFERIVAVGSSGRADVSDRHDALLADALRKEHDG